MMNEREQAKAIVERCWADAKESAETGDYCPARVGVFKWEIQAEITRLLREVSRLREIAECNDPGAVGRY